MRALPFRRLALIIGVLLMLFVVPAAYAAPKGDNVATPIDIALNSRKTVKNVQNATLEGAVTEDTTCDSGDISGQSVWFRFTAPFSMVVDLDATGAVIVGAEGTHSNVVLSYYAYTKVGDVETFTHRNCTSGTSARLVNQILSGDSVYYVRIANIGAIEPTGPSQYILSVRVRETLDIPADPWFINEALGVHWKVKHDDTPPKIVRVCPSSCWVSFTGVAKGKLVQKVNVDPSVMRFKRGDLIYATVYAFMTPPDGVHIKLSIRLDYSGGTPSTTASATRDFTNTSTGLATSVGAIMAKVAGTVTRITYSVSSPHADDTFSVLYFESRAYAGSGPRDIIPLPLAP